MITTDLLRKRFFPTLREYRAILVFPGQADVGLIVQQDMLGRIGVMTAVMPIRIPKACFGVVIFSQIRANFTG